MQDQGPFRFLLYKQGSEEISEPKDIPYLTNSCISLGISQERAQRLAEEVRGKAFTKESLDRVLIDLTFSAEERTKVVGLFFSNIWEI